MRIFSNTILAKINKIVFHRILSEMYNLYLSITELYIAVSMYMSGKS